MKRPRSSPPNGPHGSRTKSHPHRPGNPGRWRRIVAAHPLRAICVFASVLMVLAPLFVLFLRAREVPRTLMSVTAQSEILTVDDVQNADLRMPLNGARLMSATALDTPDSPPKCVHGLFTPAQHSAVVFRRLEEGPLVVDVRPNKLGISGELSDSKGSRTIRDGVVLKIDTADKDCAPHQQVVRMPVGGPVVIGDDFGPQATLQDTRPTLLSGQIVIFGRASPPLGGALGIRVEDSLYPGGTITLPPGSRLRECGGNTAWWGFVEIRLNSVDPSDRAMTIALTTSANQLALTTPGGAKTRDSHAQRCGASGVGAGQAEDVIAISTLAHLLADPYTSILWLVMLAAFAMFQMLIAALSIPHPQDHES